jgi:hypothetical protein
MVAYYGPLFVGVSCGARARRMEIQRSRFAPAYRKGELKTIQFQQK